MAAHNTRSWNQLSHNSRKGWVHFTIHTDSKQYENEIQSIDFASTFHFYRLHLSSNVFYISFSLSLSLLTPKFWFSVWFYFLFLLFFSIFMFGYLTKTYLWTKYNTKMLMLDDGETKSWFSSARKNVHN